jgi:hypothetical protein
VLFLLDHAHLFTENQELPSELFLIFGYILIQCFVWTVQRQLSEARLELEQQREQCCRLSEQLCTANEHVAFLKLDVCMFLSNFIYILEFLAITE